MMDVRPILDEADYDWALKEIERYFVAEPAMGTPDGDRFSVLATLIGDYEDRHWFIENLDPIDAIIEVMGQRGFKAADLGRVIGSRSRASELLARQRSLTMDQAWKLHREWHIPAEILLRPTLAK